MEDPNYHEAAAEHTSATDAKSTKGSKGSTAAKAGEKADAKGWKEGTQPLPSVYYINLDADQDMRRRVEKDLRKHTAKLTRVPAVDKARVLACLEKGSCAKDHRAKVLGSDYLNKDGYLYWQLHRKSIFTPGELGCTFSHLKAIQQAYRDGEETALIVEDDIVVDDMPHWTETIQDVVAEAPPDWGILQLWTNNLAFYKYIHQGQSGDQVDPASMGNMSVDPASPVCADGQYTRPAFVPWYDDVFQNTGQYYGGLWSTMAYLINRKVTRTRTRTRTLNPQPSPLIPQPPQPSTLTSRSPSPSS